jgi:hypothetical protein
VRARPLSQGSPPPRSNRLRGCSPRGSFTCAAPGGFRRVPEGARQGSEVVRRWFGDGAEMVRRWFGDGSEMVRRGSRGLRGFKEVSP